MTIHTGKLQGWEKLHALRTLTDAIVWIHLLGDKDTADRVFDLVQQLEKELASEKLTKTKEGK